MFKTVLFPIDNSREAREAAETVANIVQTYNARLVLLSVVPEQTEGQDATAEGMMSPEAVAELLKNAHNAFAKQRIEAETIERVGQPPFVICDVADDIEANLIVMGSRGMGLTEEESSSSVTSKVINLSPCPVLIVP